MDRRARELLEELFQSAEREGLWAVPRSGSEAELLRVQVDRGRAKRPLPGCYAPATRLAKMTPRQRSYTTIRTLAVLHPDWIFCRFSAAVLYGLWVPNALLGTVHILKPSTYGRTGAAVQRHRYQMEPHEIVRCQGIRVVSPQHALADCLRHASFRDALPIVDSALRFGIATASELEEYLKESDKGARGVRGALKALSYADGRSGSGGESVARAVMIEFGFQVPELQVELFDPMEPGNPKYGDFGWLLETLHPVIGELDGFEKYRASGGVEPQAQIDHAIRVMSKERRREAHINLTGAKVIRFSLRDVLDSAYFERLLDEAGVPRVAHRL